MTGLSVKNLSKSFSDTQVLNDVSFALRKGEILGLIGPNGSGKTTLLECVAGLLPFDSGEIVRENLFYMPENVLPYGDQRVRNVIEFFAELSKTDSAQVKFLVSSLDLAPVLEKRVHNLSKGFRRRLLVALGLLAPHEIVILDEPFDGLDYRQTLSLMNLLKEMRTKGKTLFLAIHQLSDAELVCDRLVLLSGGKVLAAGTLSELKAKAKVPNGRLEEVFLALT